MKRIVENLDSKSKAVWFSYFHKPRVIALKKKEQKVLATFQCGSQYFSTYLDFEGSPLLTEMKGEKCYTPNDIKEVGNIPWEDLISAQPLKWIQ